MAIDTDSGFMSRWSRRKALARQGVVPQEPVEVVPPPMPPAVVTEAPAVDAPAVVDEAAAEPATPPPPTLADVAQLTPQSDFARFVAPGVDHEVKNAAVKKLFADPHFNVMDGLDTYIDDYGKPDPLPASSVRQMAQAAFLGLLQEPAPPTRPMRQQAGEAQASAGDDTASAPCGAAPNPESNEDADLRLQSHDAAGCAGPEPGAAGEPSVEP
jgi:hypothetical protein